VTFNIPPTKVIQIDIDPREIGKNYPVEVGIIGDACATLQALIRGIEPERAGSDYRDNPRFRHIQKLKSEWHKIVRKYQNVRSANVTMAGFLGELRKFLQRDAILTGDAGHNQAQLYQVFPIYTPRTHISSGAFSTMGFAVPGAIGAKLAAPDRQVVAIVGDGGFLMTCQELATAIQYNVPIVVCISNNYGWVSIRDLQRHWYGREGTFMTEFIQEGTGKFANPDFVMFAKSFGCHAERVVKKEQVIPALRRAFKANKPAVLEIITERRFPYAELPATGWADYPTPDYLRKKT
jgi:acetolactate synthase-1/2/3 large subunit